MLNSLVIKATKSTNMNPQTLQTTVKSAVGSNKVKFGELFNLEIASDLFDEILCIFK